MSKIKYFVQESWLLLFCSFCFGLMLAASNAAWSGKIEQNRINKIKNLMSSLMPDAKNFESVLNVEVDLGKGKKANSEVFKALSDDGSCIGWSFKVEGSGFGEKIELIVAVDAGFEKMAGYNVLYSAETPGFGDKIKQDFFRDQFRGAPAGGFELAKTGDSKVIDRRIVAISGATVTSTAMVNALNNYFKQIKPALEAKGLLKNVK
jgi:RnfABCDGE-type electron transport complex G subunit